MADDIELLLRRVVTGRRKSLALLGIELLGIAAVLSAAWLVPEGLFLFADIAFVGALSGYLIWLMLGPWRDWFFFCYATFTLPPSRPAPPPQELGEAFRRLSDAFTSASDGAAVQALVNMRDRAPLTFRACMALTVVASSVQRRVRAA